MKPFYIYPLVVVDAGGILGDVLDAVLGDVFGVELFESLQSSPKPTFTARGNGF
jgi:hypothetical protein